MKSVSFTLEEGQLIIESLLFTANTDVCAEHTLIHRNKMLNLAETLNNKFDKPVLHNIFIFKDGVGEDKNTPDVIKKFSNVPLHDIISD